MCVQASPSMIWVDSARTVSSRACSDAQSGYQSWDAALFLTVFLHGSCDCGPQYGCSAFHVAVLASQFKAAELLLRRGADINSRDKVCVLECLVGAGDASAQLLCGRRLMGL